jgi:glycosyltransferase involved in cell wall biosynthesis
VQRRVCLNGHIDVVDPGTAPWRHGPWSGAVEDGVLHGRGAVDMKVAAVAALHAAAAVRARLPGAQVRIVGNGPEREMLDRLHGALGLGDAAVLLGDVSRAALAEEYVNADCFCLPSVQEGFGIVFLEAMAAGLPVVACHAAAIPEVVLDGHTGVLVPPRDPAALSTAIVRALEDERLRARMGKAGFARVSERFTVERMVAATVRVYERVAGTGHAAGNSHPSLPGPGNAHSTRIG